MIRFAIVLLALFAFGISDQQREQLARDGNIDDAAPIKAASEITINASPEKVWSLLTDVNDWPKWQSDITKAQIDGPIQVGSTFIWASGPTIHSRIALVKPFKEFVWTGTAFKAKAIHTWNLESLPEGRTLVKTKESMDGFMLSMFFSSKKLEEGQQRWLKSLKAAAER